MKIIAEGLRFPEGPVALADGSVLVCEIHGQCLTRVFPDGRKQLVADLGGGPNGAAMGPDGRCYVVNGGGAGLVKVGPRWQPTGRLPDHYKGGSVQVVDIETGKFETLYTECDGIKLRAPNDIVFDAAGGFYFTDHGKTHPQHIDRGMVYYALPDGSSIKPVIGPILTPNGVGLSPDGTTIYVSETLTGKLYAWRVTGPGQVEKMAPPAHLGGWFIGRAPGDGHFDSLAVTASGRICVGTLGVGGITEFGPEGGEGRFHPLAETMVTNLCFGGAEMRTAFVTCSTYGFLAEIGWREPGLRLNFQTF